MKCSCKMCKELFECNEIYILENGEYICKSCQEENNLKLADEELLKRFGSHDCRSL